MNGCPVYGEQISHHPPISALMFVGRGYTITGKNTLTKVNLNQKLKCIWTVEKEQIKVSSGLTLTMAQRFVFVQPEDKLVGSHMEIEDST